MTSAVLPVLGLLVAAALVVVVRRVQVHGSGIPAGLAQDRRALSAGALVALYPLGLGIADGAIAGALPAAVLFSCTTVVVVHRRRDRAKPPA